MLLFSAVLFGSGVRVGMSTARHDIARECLAGRKVDVLGVSVNCERPPARRSRYKEFTA